MDVSRRLAWAGLGKGMNAYAAPCAWTCQGHAWTLVIEPLKEPVDEVGGSRCTEQAPMCAEASIQPRRRSLRVIRVADAS